METKWNVIGRAALKMVPSFLAVLLILMFFSRCKDEPANDTSVELKVRILGHKGGGNNSYNDLHIENTLPSVQDGLKKLDGVEVDVQMSLDGTLWMFHDSDVAESGCDASYHRCIPLLTDNEIQQIQICSGSKQSRIYKLEELINYWNADPGGFYFSMHIKLDFPDDSINQAAIGGEAKYLSKMADSLAKLFMTYNHAGQVFIEVYDAKFCTKIQATIPDIKVCLLKEVTFQQQIKDALALGYDGVSCIFTEPTLSAAEVKRAQDNGLVVQLWTPDKEKDLQTAYDMNPDFIQTNNLDAINSLKAYLLP